MALLKCDYYGIIMPLPYAGALNDDAVWRLTSVWSLTSVEYIGPKSRIERPRKTKIGTEVAHVTHDSDTTFKVKRSKVKVTGAGTYCGGLPHSLLLNKGCSLYAPCGQLQYNTKDYPVELVTESISWQIKRCSSDSNIVNMLVCMGNLKFNQPTEIIKY